MAAGGRRRSIGRILILLALLLIAAVAVVFVVFRNQIMPPPAAPQQVVQDKMTSIVITTQAIARGTTLKEDVLTTVPYPEKEMVQGTFFTNIAEVVGKQAKYDLTPRVPLTSSMIVDSPVGSMSAFQIPRGMVAIAIPITRLTSVSYAPQPGDHVVLIATIMLTDVDPNFQTKLPNKTGLVLAPGPIQDPTSLTAAVNSGDKVSESGRVEMDPTLGHGVYVVASEDLGPRPRPVSQTLIQDAIVLQVGSTPLNDPANSTDAVDPQPTPAPAAGEKAPVAPPEDISLVVSPQDAVTINYLMLIGAKLNLALRSAGDIDKIKTEAVTLQFLMDQYNIPNPAKLPFAVEPRVDNLKYPDGSDSQSPTPPVQ
jgi:Flp pilus assembly protein CpaB